MRSNWLRDERGRFHDIWLVVAVMAGAFLLPALVCLWIHFFYALPWPGNLRPEAVVR